MAGIGIVCSYHESRSAQARRCYRATVGKAIDMIRNASTAFQKRVALAKLAVDCGMSALRAAGGGAARVHWVCLSLCFYGSRGVGFALAAAQKAGHGGKATGLWAPSHTHLTDLRPAAFLQPLDTAPKPFARHRYRLSQLPRQVLAQPPASVLRLNSFFRSGSRFVGGCLFVSSCLLVWDCLDLRVTRRLTPISSMHIASSAT